MDVTIGPIGRTRERPLRHIDPVLLAVTLALSVVGLFMVYSSSRTSLRLFGLDPALDVKKQLTWLVLSSIMLLFVSTFDYRYTKVYAGFLYAGLLLMLLAVRTPLGSTVKGAQRSFQLLGFAFSPSEVMKVGLIVMLAAFLSERKGRPVSLRDLVRATLIAAIPMALVFIQPDIGTTIVLAAIMVGVLIVAGAKSRHLALLGIAAALLLAGGLPLGVIKRFSGSRITRLLPNQSPSSAPYNARPPQ